MLWRLAPYSFLLSTLAPPSFSLFFLLVEMASAAGASQSSGAAAAGGNGGGSAAGGNGGGAAPGGQDHLLVPGSVAPGVYKSGDLWKVVGTFPKDSYFVEPCGDQGTFDNDLPKMGYLTTHDNRYKRQVVKLTCNGDVVVSELKKFRLPEAVGVCHRSGPGSKWAGWEAWEPWHMRAWSAAGVDTDASASGGWSASEWWKEDSWSSNAWSGSS